jgi:CheY-like chemotaxis protein
MPPRESNSSRTGAQFIWMDLRMPGMGGVDATRLIRSLENGGIVKIAGMTASAFRSDRDSAVAGGMDDLIRKPYRWQDVFWCLERHLGVRFRREPASTGAEDKVELLRPETLAALPPQLRRDLMDAVISLDRHRINSVIDRAKERARPLRRP